MNTQPTPKVTRADVERVIRRDFPKERLGEVLALLEEYGTDVWHREPHRVRLAALKLAAGNVEQLRSQIETARSDYRDVIAPAEYPGYSKQARRIRELSADERRRIIAADWRQYQDWLAQR